MVILKSIKSTIDIKFLYKIIVYKKYIHWRQFPDLKLFHQVFIFLLQGNNKLGLYPLEIPTINNDKLLNTMLTDSLTQNTGTNGSETQNTETNGSEIFLSENERGLPKQFDPNLTVSSISHPVNIPLLID